MHQLSDHDSSNHPLSGMIFCCTSVSIEIWTSISSKCKAMGGICYEDLKNDVDYLIVGERHTPKYEFATQHRFGMKFLIPEFIFEIHEKWINGRDFDVNREIEKFKLPVFSGMVISCTRISEGRQELINQLTTNGGKYSPELTKNISVLISPFQQGRKYDYAKLWGIPIVHPNWIQRSIEIGAALDETLFDLNIDPESMMKGPQQLSPNSMRKKYLDSRKNLPPNESLVQPVTAKELTHAPGIASLYHEHNRNNGFLGIVKKANSFKPFDIEDQGANFEKSENILNKNLPKETTIVDNRICPQPIPNNSSNNQRGVFSGLNFQLYGFDSKQMKILVNTVVRNGGIVCNISQVMEEKIGNTSKLSSPNYYIINSAIPVDVFEKISMDIHNQSAVKTEWFIERSISQGVQHLYHGVWGDYVTFRNISSFKNLRISISGYEDIELLQAERLIHMLGATYSAVFEPTTNILICKTVKCKKFKYAKFWKVPIVKDSWLWCCAKTGKLVDLAGWLSKGQDVEILNLPPNFSKSLDENKTSSKDANSNFKSEFYREHVNSNFMAEMGLHDVTKAEASALLKKGELGAHQIRPQSRKKQKIQFNNITESDNSINLMYPLRNTDSFQGKGNTQAGCQLESEYGKRLQVEEKTRESSSTSEPLVPGALASSIHSSKTVVDLQEVGTFSKLFKRSKSFNGSDARMSTMDRENGHNMGYHFSTGPTESESFGYSADIMGPGGGRLRGRAARSNFTVDGSNIVRNLSTTTNQFGVSAPRSSVSVSTDKSLTSTDDTSAILNNEAGRTIENEGFREGHNMNAGTSPRKPSLLTSSQSELSQSQMLFVGYSNINEKEEKRKLLRAFDQLEGSQVNNGTADQMHVFPNPLDSAKVFRASDETTCELEGPKLFEIHLKGNAEDNAVKRKSRRLLRNQISSNVEK
ncbi:hypothetical protein NADFUDRAFT_70190 [Nadsonia fulvescens var. elongata DSM 6958]|uniref:BRCT domain-containing protein n=1 Tax=Nadsonia fulvescens var. elongata DSM 6958 TaxID=857566 RepID=A0A1E3PK56_9ASCO|nr:hypothetical protein NADFUDRAFT_70190 [Nadsonia fulvescens var. elongata DSM 6958]